MTEKTLYNKGFKVNEKFTVNNYECMIQDTFGTYYSCYVVVDGFAKTLCTRGNLDTCYKKILNFTSK